mgnify:CR=1 FL=1
MLQSGFEVGDLVQLRWPASKMQSRYNIGIILTRPSPYSKSKLFKILWLTKDGTSDIVLSESFNLILLSAREGNEKRFAKYRQK